MPAGYITDFMYKVQPAFLPALCLNPAVKLHLVCESSLRPWLTEFETLPSVHIPKVIYLGHPQYGLTKDVGERPEMLVLPWRLGWNSACPIPLHFV
uniref:Uncharacterized protein n=1 Tax=Zonotrichia albicollis TaxID=44394 RepID=A0A8D2QCQ3_ZONAL